MEYFVLASETKPRTKIYLTKKKKKKKKSEKHPGREYHNYYYHNKKSNNSTNHNIFLNNPNSQFHIKSSPVEKFLKFLNVFLPRLSFSLEG